MPTWIAATSEEDRGNGEMRTGGGRPEGAPLLLTRYVLRFTLHAPRLTPRVSRSPGFTLLELSLALFIIGILVTVVVPRLGGIERARLETSAQRLAALVRYLNGEAAFRGRTYRIHYDLDQHRYGVQVLTPTQGTKTFAVDESPLSRVVQLPTSITFADIRVPSVGYVRAGHVFTHFYPQGYTDPTVIHLRDRQLRMMTVIIPPITGEAAVYEGYVDAQG